LILFLVNPIDLITPISLDYSYRLAVILVDKAKKHKNITIRIITEKTPWRSKVADVLSERPPDVGYKLDTEVYGICSWTA